MFLPNRFWPIPRSTYLWALSPYRHCKVLLLANDGEEWHEAVERLAATRHLLDVGIVGHHITSKSDTPMKGPAQRIGPKWTKSTCGFLGLDFFLCWSFLVGGKDWTMIPLETSGRWSDSFGSNSRALQSPCHTVQWNNRSEIISGTQKQKYHMEMIVGTHYRKLTAETDCSPQQTVTMRAWQIKWVRNNPFGSSIAQVSSVQTILPFQCSVFQQWMVIIFDIFR